MADNQVAGSKNARDYLGGSIEADLGDVEESLKKRISTNKYAVENFTKRQKFDLFFEFFKKKPKGGLTPVKPPDGESVARNENLLYMDENQEGFFIKVPKNIFPIKSYSSSEALFYKLFGPIGKQLSEKMNRESILPKVIESSAVDHYGKKKKDVIVIEKIPGVTLYRLYLLGGFNCEATKDGKVKYSNNATTLILDPEKIIDSYATMLPMFELSGNSDHFPKHLIVSPDSSIKTFDFERYATFPGNGKEAYKEEYTTFPAYVKTMMYKAAHLAAKASGKTELDFKTYIQKCEQRFQEKYKESTKVLAEVMAEKTQDPKFTSSLVKFRPESMYKNIKRLFDISK